EETRGRCQHRAEEANTELIRAKNSGARANGESDPRSLAEVGGRQSLRPHPIMCFVKGEICRCQQGKTNRRQRSDKKPNCARGAHVARCGAPGGRVVPLKSPRKFGWRANASGSHFR